MFILLIGFLAYFTWSKADVKSILFISTFIILLTSLENVIQNIRN